MQSGRSTTELVEFEIRGRSRSPVVSWKHATSQEEAHFQGACLFIQVGIGLRRQCLDPARHSLHGRLQRLRL
jgi:hypothetical protein